MFKSLNYSFIGKGKGFIYSFEIIDDDFEKFICITEVKSAATKYPFIEAAIQVITQCYSNKNMNVAVNIVLFLRYHLNMYGKYYNTQEFIQDYIPEEFKEQVNKYLLLL